MTKHLTARQLRRLRKSYPTVQQVRKVFAPAERELRDLKAKTYARSEAGTPLILNDEGTAVPMVVSIHAWFEYWRALTAQQGVVVDFTPVDELVAALRQGASYVRDHHIDNVRGVLNDLKTFYKSIPVGVAEDLFLDRQIKDYLDNESLEDHLNEWPEIRKEVQHGVIK